MFISVLISPLHDHLLNYLYESLVGDIMCFSNVTHPKFKFLVYLSNLCSSGLSQFCKWYHHLLQVLENFYRHSFFFPLSLLCLIHWHGMFLPNTSKPELLLINATTTILALVTHHHSDLLTVISALNVLLLLCPLLSTPHANLMKSGKYLRKSYIIVLVHKVRFKSFTMTS